MAELWQAPDEIRKLVKRIKDEHHPRLAAASLWVLCSDATGIRKNQLVATETKRCTKAEKLSTGHDFKIIVLMETWPKLTESQREVAIDEALCRCGVRRVPQSIEVNGRREVLKDDLGRVIYTDEVDVDKLGNPRWQLNPPDCTLYYALLDRHGEYGEAVENIFRVQSGRPILGPMASEQELL